MKKRTGTTSKTGNTQASGAKSSNRAAPKPKAAGRPKAKAKTSADRTKGKSASDVARSDGTGSTKAKKSRTAGGEATAAKAKTVSRKAALKSTARTAAKPRKSPKKTPPQAATSQDPIQFPEQRRRKVKTYLSAKELREFKELLLKKRAELAGDVHRLTSEALNRQKHGDGDHSSMPIHMADLGSDNWEQDFTLGLIANEEALVRDIDEALARVEDRTYGVCIATQNKISIARLRAKPWAKHCIEYAQARDAGRAP